MQSGNGVAYSARFIGGPLHGKGKYVEFPVFSVRLYPKVTLDQFVSDARVDEEVIETYTYAYSEEYTEWGNVARVFIWTRMGNLPRAEREKFIAAALTGDGKIRKITKANRNILWPDCPEEFGRKVHG